MEKYEVDMIIIPSVWPETFCFTASEAECLNIPVACFDIDEKFIIPGHGIYPLQKRFTTDKEIMDYWANPKAQPTILVKEYGMRQYSVKEAKLIDWGIVAYGKDFGRAIAMMRGEPIVCWDTYDDIYNGEPDIKVIKNSDTERSAAI